MFGQARFITISSTLIAALSGIGSAHAQAGNGDIPLVPSILIQGIASYREAYIAQLFQPFRQAAGPDQILTSEDVEREKARAVAQRRASFITMFFSADIDSDNRLTGDELGSRLQPSDIPRLKLEAWDGNRDGTVTLDEALAYAKSQAEMDPIPGRNLQLQALLELDPNKDGKLTAAELEQLGRAAFAAYDMDGDGFLSASETANLGRDRSKAMNELNLRQQIGTCNFPKVGANEKLYVIGSYEAGTLSTVSVVGQDKETETAEINIEDGDGQIYIAASSYTPMIWRVTGHVERISRFAASAGGGVGVVGVPKDKLVLVGKGECLPRLRDGNIDVQPSFRGIAASLGKPVDGLFQAYTVPKVTLPSDAISPTAWDPNKESKKRPSMTFSLGGLKPTDGDTLASLQRFSPGGVVVIDPATVIASGIAEKYQVLPQEAGLLQLLQDGSLSKRGRSGYVIEKPIPRFPAGLAGSHSVRFFLADGVPRPAGNPGHSSVTAENR